MSWISSSFRYLGLSRPYDFWRAIASLLVLSAASVVIFIALFWWRKGSLHIGSPRSWFLVYLALLIIVSVLTFKWKKFSFALIVILFAELSLSLSSYSLNRLGLVT
jgi:hypothetical protein